MGGSSYIATPEILKSKKGIVNIDNSEVTVDGNHEKCFLWSVLAHEKLAGLKPDINNHRGRQDKKISSYRKHSDW